MDLEKDDKTDTIVDGHHELVNVFIKEEPYDNDENLIKNDYGESRSTMKSESEVFLEHKEEPLSGVEIECSVEIDEASDWNCSQDNGLEIYNENRKNVNRKKITERRKEYSSLSKLPKIQKNHDVSMRNISFQYQCFYCDKEFQRRSLLIAHIKSQCEGKPFYCKEFRKKYALEINLDTHAGIEPGEKQSIKLCAETFPDLKQAFDHVKVQSSEIKVETPKNMPQGYARKKKILSCYQCGENFLRKDRLITHVRSHFGERPFGCHHCDKRFKRYADLRRHKVSHSGEKPYICEKCGKKFSQKTNLIVHERYHTGEKPFPCDQCDRRFSDRRGLVYHKFSHSGTKPFACNYCDKRFTVKGNLIVHMRTHLGEKSFSCGQCGEQFYRRDYLISHARSHSGIKHFPCDQCDKRFSFKAGLVKHKQTHDEDLHLLLLRKKHFGDKPFSCDVCVKKFTHKNSLLIHLRSHTGEKPYACEVCDKKFVSRGNLISHSKTHSVDKPYSCDICPKKFAFRGNWLSHVNSHTGTKPFTCEECDKKFALKGSLARHMKARHEETETITFFINYSNDCSDGDVDNNENNDD